MSTTIAGDVLSSAHLKAIGLVAAEWSYTESALELLIWEVTGIPNDVGYAMTTHIGSETRIHVLEAVAEKRIIDDTLRASIKAIAARIRTLRVDRNNIVHSVWLNPRPPEFFTMISKRGRKPTPMGIKISAKGKVNITNTPYASKRILETAHKIGALLLDMYRLVSDLREARPRLEQSRQTRASLVAALSAQQKLARAARPKTKAP